MSFATIDLDLESWAASHGLLIQSKFKDAEVRSIDIVSPEGQRFQMWLDEPDSQGDIEVHVWDFKDRRRDYKAPRNLLKRQLEAAYNQAKSWF